MLKYWKAFCKGSNPKRRSWRAGVDTLTSFTLINRRGFQNASPKQVRRRVGCEEGLSDPTGVAGESQCPLATRSCQRRDVRDGSREPPEGHFAQRGSSSCHPKLRFGNNHVQGDGSIPVAFVSLIANSQGVAVCWRRGGGMLEFIFSLLPLLLPDLLPSLLLSSGGFLGLSK